MTQQNLQSSCGTYLSGHSNGEGSANNNHAPSQYLSPIVKHQDHHTGQGRPTSGFNLGSELLNSYSNTLISSEKRSGLLDSSHREDYYRRSSRDF